MRPMLKALFFIGFMAGLMNLGWAGPPKITKFNITPTTITLTDQDPDLFPELSSATPLQVNFQINSEQDNDSWSLEIYTPDDLLSGTDRITIDKLRWEVSGQGTHPANYQNGTFSKGLYLMTANGLGDSKKKKIVMDLVYNFYLQNLWTYSPGTYSQLFTLRLTASDGQGPTRDVETLSFTISVTINQQGKLNFFVNSLNFPDENPDLKPSVPAAENSINVTASARTGASQTLRLTCQADGDLVSGSNTISIDKLSWQAAGPGYQAGVMSISPPPRVVGSWTGPGSRSGTLDFFFANSWNYYVGQYTATITYFLSAI